MLIKWYIQGNRAINLDTIVNASYIPGNDTETSEILVRHIGDKGEYSLFYGEEADRFWLALTNQDGAWYQE